MNTLEHPDIVALLDAITHENWFDQLHPLADRFLELGDQAKYDRCVDLIVEYKRPHFEYNYFFWDEECLYKYSVQHGIPSKTLSEIDWINYSRWTGSIKPQLTGYLRVPEELRVPRTKGR